MIAAWMAFSLAVTLMLVVAGMGLEYVARALRAPTRIVWTLCIVAAMTLSARALISAFDARSNDTVTSLKVRTVALDGAIRNGFGRPAAGPGAANALAASSTGLFAWIGARAATVRASVSRIDVKPLEPWNTTLVMLWIAASLLAIARLASSLLRLRSIERHFAPATIDDQRVFVSRDVGPALFGVLRSRIVLPEWALALPASERRVILAHERQHAQAFDPALVHAAAFVVALQPWNVALWMLFSRLRFALESDCDARVLGASGDVREYGKLLVAIHERSTPGAAPLIAFARRTSNLERRVRHLVRKPRLLSFAGAVSAFVAVVLVATAWTATPPQRRAAVVAPSRQPTARRKRCPIFGRPSPQRPSGGESIWFPGGCSIDGDIVVVSIDSTRVLVAARDTADDHVTSFVIFETAVNAFPANLAWSSTHGHGELSDSVLAYTSPDGGSKPLLFQLRKDAKLVRPANTHVTYSENILVSQMHGIAWDIIAALPSSPRCTGTPLRQKQSGPNAGQWKDDVELARVCFIVNGTPFDFPIP